MYLNSWKLLLFGFLASGLVEASRRLVIIPSNGSAAELDDLRNFIEDAENDLLKDYQIASMARWAHDSNITDHNEKNNMLFQVRLKK